ncbi:integrator complex subunit 8-like isoform X2 [Montipora capricornis]|uniref:integrator complex subunit 8-like isoform X2 n=1 Tax=Montipora capricornis TaxID=246305 RepID=UPI0035F1F065
MAVESNGKSAPKTAVSWFEFLFDKTGDVLKKHLEDKNAEPSATQLIIQFLERSGLFNNVNAGAEASPVIENKIPRDLCNLALRITSHLKWNLEILEENLPLQCQNFLLGELMKMDSLQNGLWQSDIDISRLDQKTTMALIIYHRWVVRTLSQHFLPNIGKATNIGGTAENLANENILRKLQEQLPTAICILDQALLVTEDMPLPTAPLLSEPRKQITEQESTFTDAEPTNDGISQNNGGDINNENKVENVVDTENNAEECNNAVNVKQNMDISTEEEVYKVKKDEIVAQVSFDLGTLYFYQENFQQAVKMFESCKNAQCSQSSFYTVNENKLSGYYMACCGLTGLPPSTTRAPLEESKSSLIMRLEQCRHSGYKDVIALLLEDNISFELPLEYRECLVTELKAPSRRMSDDSEGAMSISLDWQVLVCNVIRDVLEGRPTKPGFLLSLQNCSQPQLDCIFSLCLQSLSSDQCISTSSIRETKRFKVLKSFVQLVSCNCERVNDWEIIRNSDAKIFVEEEDEAMDVNESEDNLPTSQQKSTSHTPVLKPSAREAGEEKKELEKGFLCDKLRHSVDPVEISTLVEQLQQLDKGQRVSEEFHCLLYENHLEEIKNLQQQNTLHVLFSKALNCSVTQEYRTASQLFAYALGMVNAVAGRSGNSPLDKVKAAIHQELLVLDICQESHNKRADELLNRVKSYMWQTSSGTADVHIEEQMNAFLLNGKEWELLAEIRVDENAPSLDHRSLSSLLASTCCYLSKPQGWRKPVRNLWDGVLKIFSNSNGQQKRSADGGPGIVVTHTTHILKLTNFIHFARKIKEETVLTVLISCLARLRNTSSKVDESGNVKEISSSHSDLWPTAIANASSINFDHIGLALSAVVHHALSVQQHNVSWLQTLGDIYLDSGNYSSALRCYLEAGAVASSFFHEAVPTSVWDDQVYRKMVSCCSAMKAHVQAALLCQCMEVKDYSAAFKALQQASSASSDAMDFYYTFFWDITLLEYLAYTHAKRGQSEKKLLTVQAISQPELNIFNSSELLQHTEQSKRAKLLRTLAKQYL